MNVCGGDVWCAEGKTLANDNGCKYTEVSAILNHKVDDLLVGILKQIRLSATQQRHHQKHRDRSLSSRQTANDVNTTGCLTKTRNRVLAKLLRVGSKRRGQASKSCENLLSL